jgi:hypothetical protein
MTECPLQALQGGKGQGTLKHNDVLQFEEFGIQQ